VAVARVQAVNFKRASNASSETMRGCLAVLRVFHHNFLY